MRTTLAVILTALLLGLTPAPAHAMDGAFAPAWDHGGGNFYQVAGQVGYNYVAGQCDPVKVDVRKVAVFAPGDNDGEYEDSRRAMYHVSFTVSKRNGEVIFARYEKNVPKHRDGRVYRVWKSKAVIPMRRLVFDVAGTLNLDHARNRRFHAHGEYTVPQDTCST